MSVVNAASVQSAANVVAAMRAAAVVVVAAVAASAPKAALSGRVNAAQSVAKAAPRHGVSAALKDVQKVVLNARPLKAVLKVVAKIVAVRNAPAKLAQTCELRAAMKAALRASPATKVKRAAKAVVTVPAVIVQNALSAPAHPATQPKKNWHWPIRPPWPPLHAVT
jgi:hypothetical protein